MTPAEFDVIFRGDIVIGHQLQDVKTRLQQLFKTDAARIDALFTGRPVPLKRGLDEATANKYRAALMKAGAQVEVCAAGSVKSGSAAEAAKAETAKRIRPVQWSLAPAGSYLLKPIERRQTNAVDVDVSGFSLRAEGGNLVDASEVTQVEAAPVVVPDFSLAETGADLLNDNEKNSLPLMEIDVEDWGVADVGADLLTAAERTVAVAAIDNVEDFGLAPLGSDLGQLKPTIEPLAPDISQLRLAEN